nr:MetaGeneMark_Unknown Function [uncultured bacterium]
MFATLSKGSNGDDIRLATASPLYGIRFSDAQFREAIPGDVSSAYPHVFKVSLKAPGLESQGLVKAAPLVLGVGLAQFLDGLRDAWTGWDGDRTWTSQRFTTREIHVWDDWPGPDNQLSLQAASDRNGHVTFRFDLIHRSERRSPEIPPHGYTSSVSLSVQSTVVPELARAVRNFLRKPA